MRRGELQEVELVDRAPVADPPAPGRSRTRRRLWLAGGAAAVVLLLGGVQAVLSAREDAAVARLQVVPGVLRPVDDTLEVVRRLTPDDTATLTGQAEGALVPDEDGGLTYRWFAPGDLGWTARLDPPTGAPTDQAGVLGASACQTDDGTEDARRIVCLVKNGAQVVPGSGELRTATTTEAVVLDASGGTTLARWPLDHGTSVAPFPGDLVVVASATAQTLLVTGHDAPTGAQRWTFREPSGPGPAGLSVFRAGDLVGVATPVGELRLLSHDGVLVRDDLALVGTAVPGSPGLRWGWGTAPDRSLVVVRQTAGRIRSTLVAANGDPAADRTVDGEIVPSAVDDGSVPNLLLTADRSVHAWDARSGRARWSADLTSTTDALVLRGRVYLTTTAREVVALDGRSGREVWRSDPLDGLSPVALLTDAAHVLVATVRTSVGTEPALVAYETASGDEAFRAPYPPGVTDLHVLGHTLVGRDEESSEQVELG